MNNLHGIIPLIEDAASVNKFHVHYCRQTSNCQSCLPINWWSCIGCLMQLVVTFLHQIKIMLANLSTLYSSMVTGKVQFSTLPCYHIASVNVVSYCDLNFDIFCCVSFPLDVYEMLDGVAVYKREL